jgi:hypothetical protein
MDKVTAIRAARVQLRARGEPETQARVLALVGGSKSTVQKYWSVTGPKPEPEPAPAPEPPAPVPVPPEPEPQNTLQTPEPPNALPRTPPPPARGPIPMERLRAHFADPIASGGFGNNVRLDEREYPLLERLLTEARSEMEQAAHERFRMYQDPALLKHGPNEPERLPLRIVEDTWRRAMGRADLIKTAMARIRADLRYQGKDLP